MWKSKGLSDESIKPPSTTNNILNPLLGYVGAKTKVEFKRSCSKQDKVYPTLENCLFGAVKLRKHLDIDNCKCSEYGIGFDGKGFFFIW